MWYIKLAETNLFPDWLLRLGVRISLWIGVLQKKIKPFAEREEEMQRLIEKLKASPVAVQTDKPNVQHYEVPSDFFALVLGPQLKYSCCYWPKGVDSLQEAEEAMLSLTADRARLQDGMHILDLGCGWGSFSLWAARRYPNTSFTAISNSRTQKEFIDERCRNLDLGNVRTITADIAELDFKGRYDRIISIEMFEHMKNYKKLLEHLCTLLNAKGMLFIHIFSNMHLAHEFNVNDRNSWMAKTFFTGGIMPSDDLLLHFQEDLCLQEHWRLNGKHYTRTLKAWLENMYKNKKEIFPILSDTYGYRNRKRWWFNWKLFFLGCAETWRLKKGEEFIVSHYLFSKRD